MNIDLRFTTIPYELMMLGEYITLVRERLPSLIEAGKTRIGREYDSDDESERSIATHLEWQLDAGITTRFLTAAALMAVWAAYETSVKDIARYVQRAREIRLSMGDLRSNFLDRARKYFDDVLGFDLHTITTDWERLRMIATLRHALAHANGRLPHVNKPQREQIKRWADSAIDGPTVVDEYIVLSVDFVSNTHLFVDKLLGDLITRTQAAFPLRPGGRT